MIQYTPEEKAAAHSAKLHHKQFVKTNSKRAKYEQDIILAQILDSPTPDWGNLIIKIEKY